MCSGGGRFCRLTADVAAAGVLLGLEACDKLLALPSKC